MDGGETEEDDAVPPDKSLCCENELCYQHEHTVMMQQPSCMHGHRILLLNVLFFSRYWLEQKISLAV